jgi:peptidoglycan/LPS O-acetylase OafA/YrhL
MISDPNAKPRRDHLVEVLRFLACAIVACHHFICEFFPKTEFGSDKSFVMQASPAYSVSLDLSNSLLNIFNAGSFAVCLFLILSGYILVKPHFSKSELVWSSLTGDAIKRIVRLGLPLWTAIFVCFACTAVGWFQGCGQAVAPISGSGWAKTFFHEPGFAWNVVWRSLLQPFQNGQEFIPPVWTLNVELIGSYLSYGLVGVMHSSPLSWFIGISAVYLAPAYYKCFALGVLFAFAECNLPVRFRTRWRQVKTLPLFHLFGLILLAGSFYLAAYPGQQLPVGDLDQTIFAPLKWLKQVGDGPLDCVGTAIPAAFAAFAVAKLWYNDLRVFDLLAPLGKYTYMIYLVHFILLGTTVSWAFLSLESLPLKTPTCLILTFVYYVGCIAACCTLNKYIDGNAIALSHKLKSVYINTLRNSA